jgi:hypothetical protein
VHKIRKVPASLWKATSTKVNPLEYSLSSTGRPGRWPLRMRQKRMFSRPHDTKLNSSKGEKRILCTGNSDICFATIAVDDFELMVTAFSAISCAMSHTTIWCRCCGSVPTVTSIEQSVLNDAHMRWSVCGRRVARRLPSRRSQRISRPSGPAEVSPVTIRVSRSDTWGRR